MKLTRAVVLSGLAASAIALTACSSSGSSTTSTGTTGGASSGGSTTSSATSGGSGDINCATGTLNGSGSTAQTNAMDAWRAAYQKACSGATINYDSVGSGDGISAFEAGNANFAGSDAALSGDDIAAAKKQCGSDAIDLPMVVGPIAVVFNLPSVKNVVLNGPTIAKIFTGAIKNWDDPAIKALNSGASLPNLKITPFYRKDSSGTTFNFTGYLKAASKGAFTKDPNKESQSLGFAGQGRDGSQGIADSVAKTSGGIGYTEFSYAVKGNLAFAQIDSGSGPVTLSKDTAAKAVSTAKIVGTGNDLSLSIDYGQNTPGAYPVVLVTYEIACTTYKDAAVGKFVKSFLEYTVLRRRAGHPAGLGLRPAARQHQVEGPGLGRQDRLTQFPRRADARRSSGIQ